MNLPPLSLVEIKADQAVLELVMEPTLDAFRDHFPDHPILPGVVQIDWAVRLATQQLGLDLIAARDFQVKFRGIIRSGMTITLTLRHNEALKRLSFEYRHGDEIMSSGQIRLSCAA